MAVNVDGRGRPVTCSGGGPVIAVPAEVAAAWRGTLPPIGAPVPKGWSWGNSGGPVCDYDRACDVDYVRVGGYGGFALLDVGGARALALDAELVTTFLADPDGGYLIRGEVEGPSSDPTRVPADRWRELGTIDLVDGRLFVFDSASDGAADPEAIPADDGVAVAALGPGRWTVWVAANDHVDFARFRRA